MDNGYPEDWDSRRREVYQRDGYACQNCGRQGGPGGNVELHAHHVVPKSKGGTHQRRNLITVCAQCHRAIHGQGKAPVPIDQGDLSERIRQAIERHYRTDATTDGYVRLGKSSGDRGRFQSRADRVRNEKYDGCPNCGQWTLTVSWVGFKPGSKTKIVECESCPAQYDERLVKIRGEVTRTLSEIDDLTEVDRHGSAVLQEVKEQLRLRFNI